MMNLSSLYKVKIATVILGCFLLFDLVEASLGDRLDYILLGALVLGLLLLCYIIYLINKVSGFLDNISAVCRDVRVGNFESRIINKTEGRELKLLADSVNNSIDISDAFVREAALAMQAASEGKYYRKIRPEGLQGMFLHSANNINKAVDFLKDKDEADIKNKKMVELTIANINMLVNNASRGNLDERAELDGLEGEYRDLMSNMNNLMQIILEPLQNIMAVLRTLSEGDLTKNIKEDYEGIFDEIKQAVNDTIGRLSQIASDIKSSAEMVKNSSSEISASSSDLSRRTENQTSTLEETTASMEELTATVTHNTENSERANDSSLEAKNIAESGGATVKSVVKAMEDITESSTKISDIISVIDEIAFQTNLLALNAAVEAARAGDAGKGFAVVADEVRTLAGRSAEASKEIKNLIQTSVDEVNKGNNLATEAGSSLDKIVESFADLAAQIGSIADASKEQAAGIKEVNAAVTEMDSVTQQNAAMVEENTAASQSLSELADNLTNLIGFFKIGDEIADNNTRSNSTSHMASDRMELSAAEKESLLQTVKAATGAHGSWKLKLSTAIKSGSSEASASDVKKDNLCEFGKWLYSDILPPSIKSSEDFVKIKGLHAEFHKIAGGILEMISSGRIDEAKVFMGDDGEYTKISTTLISELTRWRTKISSAKVISGGEMSSSNNSSAPQSGNDDGWEEF